MKCLEIAKLQDFAPNTQELLGALSGPQTPCRIERTPLWKFLPTGLIRLVHGYKISWVTGLLHYNIKTIHYFDNRSQEFNIKILIIFSTKITISHLQEKFKCSIKWNRNTLWHCCTVCDSFVHPNRIFSLSCTTGGFVENLENTGVLGF